MDGMRFDHLAKTVAVSGSRRRHHMLFLLA
jgi:hypothetical protein